MGHLNHRNSEDSQGGIKMKRSLKIVAFILLLSIAVGAFSGCAQIFYGARIYDDIDKNLVLDTFRWNNPIYVTTENPSHPDSRSFVIADKATYDTVFVDSAFDINFDREMILLCTFSNWHHRPYYLDKISIKDGKATVYIRMQRRNVNDCCQVYQKWIAVRMRKVDIDSVEFYEWKSYGGRYEKI